MFGDAPEPEPLSDTETVALGYSLALALDLWTAWVDHNVMPRRGGYLDQPRRWQRLIHTMNRRYNAAYLLAKTDHVPPDGSGGDKDEDVLQDYLGAVPYADGARPSWERFKGTG